MVPRVLRDLGRRIAELRDDRRITQAALAEEVGIATRSMQRIESGEVTTTAVLVRVAVVLQTPLRTLFDPPRSRARRPRGRPAR